MTLLKRWLVDELVGQTLVEYALLLGVVVVGVLLVTTWTGLAAVLQAAMSAVAGAV